MSEIYLRLESSPVGFHGFSHREICDYTETLAVFLEVVNPGQGAYRGKNCDILIATDKDAFYTIANQIIEAYSPYS